eukprot:980439-Pleurochrysis_carterae.AAC.1
MSFSRVQPARLKHGPPSSAFGRRAYGPARVLCSIPKNTCSECAAKSAIVEMSVEIVVSRFSASVARVEGRDRQRAELAGQQRDGCAALASQRARLWRESGGAGDVEAGRAGDGGSGRERERDEVCGVRQSARERE